MIILIFLTAFGLGMWYHSKNPPQYKPKAHNKRPSIIGAFIIGLLDATRKAK